MLWVNNETSNSYFFNSFLTFQGSEVYKFIQLSPIDGEGDGTPLQYSCLENPMDGGTW